MTQDPMVNSTGQEVCAATTAGSLPINPPTSAPTASSYAPPP